MRHGGIRPNQEPDPSGLPKGEQGADALTRAGWTTLNARSAAVKLLRNTSQNTRSHQSGLAATKRSSCRHCSRVAASADTGSDQFLHPQAQHRQRLLLEPRVVAQPALVARAGVRHGQEARPVRSPCRDGGHAVGFVLFQMAGLGDTADDPGELPAGQQVSATACAWKAQAHGQDRHAPGVVEHGRVNAHPGAQAVTTRVTERHAAVVGLAPWRLAGDEDRGTRVELKNRPRRQRLLFGAQGACAHLVQQVDHGARTGQGSHGWLRFSHQAAIAWLH